MYQSNMELPLQATFSWYSDIEANDTWSLKKGLNIANDTDLPVRTLKIGHNVQLRENTSFADPAQTFWQVPSYDGLKGFSATCVSSVARLYHTVPRLQLHLCLHLQLYLCV